MDPKLQKDLRKIEGELKSIRQQTSPGWKRLILNGMLQGAGWVVGSIIGIILLGWLLSIMGVIPGFGQLASKVQAAVQERSRF